MVVNISSGKNILTIADFRISRNAVSSGSALSSRASDVSAGARGGGAAREQRHSCKIICVAICKVVLVTIALGFSCRGQTSQQSSPRPSTSGAQSLLSSALKEIEADLQAGRFNEAQAKTEALIKTQPNNALAWVYLGMASLELEQTEEAIQAFERAIAINPKDPIPYLNVALLYASRNDLDRAIDRYQKVLAIDKRNGTAYYNYARLLIKRESFTEAVVALRQAIQINPADNEARTTLVEALLQAKQRQQASDQVLEFLELKPTPVPALVSMGALLVRGGEVDLARAVLTKALSMAPESAAVHIELSKLSLAAGRQKDAVQAAQRALALAPASLEANLALAKAFISGRQNQKALDHLLKSEPQFKGDASFHYTLGIAQLRTSHFPPAIAAFRKSIQLNARFDPAHFLLGVAYLAAGDLGEAEAALKAATLLNSKSALYCNYLARVYEKKGSSLKELALENTKKALALEPKDIESRERLAKWAKEEGDLPRARALLEGIIADDPELISTRVLLSSVYYRLNLREAGNEQQEIIRSLEAKAQKLRPSPKDPDDRVTQVSGP